MAVTALNLHFTDTGKWPVVKFSKNYAVITVKTFDLGSKKQYRQIIDGLFEKIEKRKIPNLIIDLRGNFGGAPYYASYLLSYLISKPIPYLDKSAPFYFFAYKRDIKPKGNRFTGHVYTLINGSCFSTTGHFVSLLKYHRISTFIGEETGGSFICTDGAGNMTLKNTRLRLHYATTPFRAAAYGLRKGRGIMPDVNVSPSIQDYLEERDPLMKTAIDLADRQ